MGKIVPELTRIAAQELVDEQRKEFRLIGSQRRIPGLILFEYDLTTGELQRASMKKEVQLNIDGTIGKNSHVDSKDLCLYIQALNEENAMRKVRKMLRRKSTRESLFKPQSNGE
ncbi:MAG: hypothetical protein II008_20945 [Oscillospiraceae bacterium]|nr:hypothetical protein [Oscillospiraceae bacterium]